MAGAALARDVQYQRIAESMKNCHEAGIDWSNIYFVSSDERDIAKMSDCLSKEGVQFEIQRQGNLDKTEYINSLSETVKEAASSLEIFKKSLNELKKHLDFKVSPGIKEQAREIKDRQQMQR